MKKIAIAITLSASVLGLAACNSDDSSKVVAESGAGNVTKEEFYQELKNSYGASVLQQLVTEEVLSNKYDVSEEEVDKELQSVKDQLGDRFQQAIQQQGFKDEEAFRKMLRLSLLQEAAVAEDIEITEEELKKQYERKKTEVQAQHILVKDEKTAKEVKKKLDNGGDFAKLAKEYSTDKSNAEDGGKLGYFSTGKMVAAFEDAAYSMDAGEISDPVKTQHGFHIIKVTDKREKEKDIGSFEDNKKDIRRSILNQRMDPQKAREKINKLIKDANVDIKVEGLEDILKQPKKGKAQG